MAIVPAGSILEYTVTGTVRETRWFWETGGEYTLAGLSPDALKASVLERLGSHVAVVRFELEANASWRTETWSYRALIVVRTLIDHAVFADVHSIVEGAFWVATDIRPVVTSGSWTQPAIASSGASGVGWSLTMGAIIVVGALVLLVWAKP